MLDRWSRIKVTQSVVIPFYSLTFRMLDTKTKNRRDSMPTYRDMISGVVRQSAAWGENKKCRPCLILSGYSSKISTFLIILRVVTLLNTRKAKVNRQLRKANPGSGPNPKRKNIISLVLFS